MLVVTKFGVNVQVCAASYGRGPIAFIFGEEIALTFQCRYTSPWGRRFGLMPLLLMGQPERRYGIYEDGSTSTMLFGIEQTVQREIKIWRVTAER